MRSFNVGKQGLSIARRFDTEFLCLLHGYLFFIFVFFCQRLYTTGTNLLLANTKKQLSLSWKEYTKSLPSVLFAEVEPEYRNVGYIKKLRSILSFISRIPKRFVPGLFLLLISEIL